jgi:hypothetical protein
VFCIYEERRLRRKGGLRCPWTRPLWSTHERPWKIRAKLIDPGLPPNIRIPELQTAKEILAEVFRARPGEVEEMIQKKLEKTGGPEEEYHEDGLWPQEFCPWGRHCSQISANVIERNHESLIRTQCYENDCCKLQF